MKLGLKMSVGDTRYNNGFADIINIKWPEKAHVWLERAMTEQINIYMKQQNRELAAAIKLSRHSINCCYRRSKPKSLLIYQNDLLDWKSKGATAGTVAKYLTKHGYEVSEATVRRDYALIDNSAKNDELLKSNVLPFPRKANAASTTPPSLPNKITFADDNNDDNDDIPF
ncbi:MAG: hypothetical protein ABSC18_09000 [Verrucomicrobiota bacterium]